MLDVDHEISHQCVILKFGLLPYKFILRCLLALSVLYREKFDFKVTSYMMELYNDKLLDLYAGKDGTPDVSILLFCCFRIYKSANKLISWLVF